MCHLGVRKQTKDSTCPDESAGQGSGNNAITIALTLLQLCFDHLHLQRSQSTCMHRCLHPDKQSLRVGYSNTSILLLYRDYIKTVRYKLLCS